MSRSGAVTVPDHRPPAGDPAGDPGAIRRVLRRVSWRVSRDASTAVCTAIRDQAPPLLEVYRDGEVRRHAVAGLSSWTQLVPRPDGAVTLCHHRQGRHDVEVLTTEGELVPVVSIAEGGLWLLDPVGEQVWGVAALPDGKGGYDTHVRLLTAAGAPTRVTFPGLAAGGVWLDEPGERLVLNLVTGGDCRVVQIDLGIGEVGELFSVRPGSDDRVLDYQPESDLLVVSTNAGGHLRLGVGGLGRPVTFPESLTGGAGVSLVAAAPDGGCLVVAEERGAVSRLREVALDLHDPMSARATDLPTADLVVAGRGAIAGGRLTLPVCTTVDAGRLLVLPLGEAGPAPAVSAPVVPDGRGAGGTVRVGDLPGAQGPVEAVLLGDARTARQVVVLLHGGPNQAWRAVHDPFLAGLADAGVAVVAPNVRGSTGYGRAHAEAIVGRWGGPDLDDVLAVGRHLADVRAPGLPRPVVAGMSYGAWLAVLAAARGGLWSGCAAMSPFCSADEVAARGGQVAKLVVRLGGQGSADLRAVAEQVDVPVLVMHGERDDVVPASDSTALVAALGAPRAGGAGRPVPDVRHLVLADTGHDLVDGRHHETVLQAVLTHLRLCSEARP